jgi:hypothetical protein
MNKFIAVVILILLCLSLALIVQATLNGFMVQTLEKWFPWNG